MTPVYPLTDVLARAQAGDRQAFDALTGPLRHRLVAFVQSRLGKALQGRLDAEDVVQEACLRAFESIAAFRGKDSAGLWSWLTSIAEHLIWNASRSRSLRESSLSLDHLAKHVSPSRALRREERMARIERSLSRLRPEQREVLLLAKIDGLPAKEIAARLGRSEVAVRQTISRALKELRAALDDTASLNLPDRPLGDGGDHADR